MLIKLSFTGLHGFACSLGTGMHIAMPAGAVAKTQSEQRNGRQNVAQDGFTSGHDGNRKQVCISGCQHLLRHQAFKCLA